MPFYNFLKTQSGISINLAHIVMYDIDEDDGVMVFAKLTNGVEIVIWEDSLENCKVVKNYLDHELARAGLDLTQPNEVLLEALEKE